MLNKYQRINSGFNLNPGSFDLSPFSILAVNNTFIIKTFVEK